MGEVNSTQGPHDGPTDATIEKPPDCSIYYFVFFSFFFFFTPPLLNFFIYKGHLYTIDMYIYIYIGTCMKCSSRCTRPVNEKHTGTHSIVYMGYNRLASLLRCPLLKLDEFVCVNIRVNTCINCSQFTIGLREKKKHRWAANLIENSWGLWLQSRGTNDICLL